MKQKESSPCGLYFSGTSQTLAVVRNPTTSQRAINGQTPSQQGPSHIFLQNLCTEPIGRHPSRQGHNQMTCLTRTSDLDPNSTVMSIIQAIWRFRQRCHRTLEVCFPQVQSGLWSSKNVVFWGAEW